MMLTLDSMAQRYGQLPSYVMQHGSTFDLAVLDIAFKWERLQQQRAEDPNKAKSNTHNLTQAEMRAMIDRVRKQDERKNN
jgi:hypothetical protein